MNNPPAPPDAAGREIYWAAAPAAAARLLAAPLEKRTKQMGGGQGGVKGRSKGPRQQQHVLFSVAPSQLVGPRRRQREERRARRFRFVCRSFRTQLDPTGRNPTGRNRSLEVARAPEREGVGGCGGGEMLLRSELGPM